MSLVDLQIKLSPEMLQEIIKGQEELQKNIRSISKDGMVVYYDKMKIRVLPDVFIPLEESRALISNFVVHPNDEVLDVCTGSGIIAFAAAEKGAKRIVGLDINPVAVKCARENAQLLGFSTIVDIRLSDVYEALQPDETFDVITSNPPFFDLPAHDAASRAFWDENLQTQKRFFAGLQQHLKPKGRAYLCQSNIGPLDRVEEMAREAGFRLELLAESSFDNSIPEAKFLVLEIIRLA